MTDIPGIIVPDVDEDVELEEMIDEVGVQSPLITFPSAVSEEESWSGAFDAMIAAGLFEL